jgi:putative membrane-bound dehydrogenase-like protein
MFARSLLCSGLFVIGALATQLNAAEPWLAGFSRVDVTPGEPVRMAGYGSRDHASEGVDAPLYVRCMGLKSPSSEHAALLISVETIGLPGSMTRELAEQIHQQHGTPREQIVFCSTHTHAAPDLVSELSNIFARELSADEVAAGKRYQQQLREGILEAVAAALADLSPARLAYGVGQATFAANRRVLSDGRWTGFGVQSDGPVDHAVPVLRIVDPNHKLRGVVFNYACHCTTLGGDHYRINGDWAGYAAADLESKWTGAVALCTIGCGADANPEPRGTLEATLVHGRTLAAEVARIIDGQMKTIDAPLKPRFDYAALSFDLPTQEELRHRAEDAQPQTRRHAERMLDVLQEHGRLPATYPVPIQSWQFGEQLTMVFLGGEVVVDYALRLKRVLDKPDLWVTAYTNDVLGYICSERMRQEGGYEYDRSGIYYGLPGTWASGSEDLLVSRVQELLRSQGRSQPLSPGDALDSFRLSDGFEIELVAAEPLVQDPINLAFDARGRLWVVEMGDYPEGESGGRVKLLTDRDGDGVFDTASEFLSQLSFPTGAFPWRDGVLISAAPDILLARDTDEDGKADQVETLYTGFALANPQHRINGFTYGLDHSLHLASGDNLGQLRSVRSGQSVDASGHDVQIWPDSGRIAVTSGRTQYIRSRNDWGEWFGNDNSRPMYHFPIDDAYLSRNPAVRYSSSMQMLFDPPVAPPVFPITSVSERFNDLFAAGRFTSACSAIVARSPQLESGLGEVAFICEPVHNLVHRAVLRPHGASYQAERAAAEQDREFLSSSDRWFRPVRALVGPDGMLYVVDMYRETIEHPEWIPEAWQSQLDLRAGADRGRIYRIRPRGTPASTPPRFDLLSTAQLVGQLAADNGALRDLVQQWIIERDDDGATPLLIKLAADAGQPHARVHALSILEVQQRLDTELLAAALQDSHPGVLLVAIPIAESRLESDPQWLEHLAVTARHRDERVVLRTALALGQSREAAAGRILADIACGEHGEWVSRAVSSSASPHADAILSALLDRSRRGDADLPSPVLTDLLVTARSNGVDIASHCDKLFAVSDADFLAQLRLASSFTAVLGADKSNDIARWFQPLYARAVALAGDEQQAEQQRCAALQLVGLGIGSESQEQALLLELISPATPVSVQQQAVDRLAQFSDAEPCAELVARWPSMSRAVRDHAVSRMLQRRTWTEQLLAALDASRIKPSDLTPAARQQLTQTGTRSMQVRAARLTQTSGSPEKQTLVASYLQAMSGQPDVARGAALFQQHCAVCHQSGAGGQAVGASLDNLSDRSAQALLTAILDPNRAVDPKYQSYVVLSDDDRVLVGAIEDEAGASLTLAHADGKRSTIARAAIVEMKNTGVSLMPEGLESVLSPAAMLDLVGYLQTATPHAVRPR